MSETYVLSHREYITDISSAPTNTSGLSSFQLQSFYINPGNSLMMPWGSSIASNYTSFRFKKLIFEFVSTSATALNSTNTALGLVFARPQNDPTLSPDVNSLQMLNSHGVKKANPSQSWKCAVDVSEAAFAYGTITQSATPSALPNSQDSRLFFPNGFFEIATQGMQANNVNLGELFVDYTLELIRPVYQQGQLGYTMRTAHYTNNSFTGAAPLGTSNSQVVKYDNVGISFNSAGTVLSFPASITTGVYQIQLSWTGSVAGLITFPTPSLYTNCSPGPAIYLNSTQPAVSAPSATVSSTSSAYTLIVSINAPGAGNASITFSSCVLPTGTLLGDIVVTQINGKIV